MAHFYGSIRGNRGEATRLGSMSSGMVAKVASWRGCVETYLYYDDTEKRDIADVRIRPWQGHGIELTLYRGPVHPDQPHEMDQALRCKTCVNYCNWEPNTGRPAVHCEPSVKIEEQKGDA